MLLIATAIYQAGNEGRLSVVRVKLSRTMIVVCGSRRRSNKADLVHKGQSSAAGDGLVKHKQSRRLDAMEVVW